jgi:MYND finger
MRCAVCKIARGPLSRCGHCTIIYCGIQCQAADWTRGHSKLCPIEGHEKRGREEPTPCRSDTDPISLEEFAGMDENLKLTLSGERCYHLPGLYNWAITLQKNVDPYTNTPFEPDDLERIESAAMARYPLTVRFVSLQDRIPDMHTTSALTISGLAIQAYNHAHAHGSVQPKNPVETVYQFMTRSVTDSYGRLRVKIAGMYREMELELRDHYNDTLMTLGANVLLEIIVGPGSGTPEAAVRRGQALIDVAARKGWPTDVFNRYLQTVQNQ